jgi:hypothetical protein
MTLEIHVMTKDRHICGAVKPVYGIPTGSSHTVDDASIILHSSRMSQLVQKSSLSCDRFKTR